MSSTAKRTCAHTMKRREKWSHLETYSWILAHNHNVKSKIVRVKNREQQRRLIIWRYAQWKGTNRNQTKQVTYVSISFLHTYYTSEHCDIFNTNTRTHSIVVYRPHLMITHAHTTIHLTHTTDLWLGYAWQGTNAYINNDFIMMVGLFFHSILHFISSTSFGTRLQLNKISPIWMVFVSQTELESNTTIICFETNTYNLYIQQQKNRTETGKDEMTFCFFFFFC